MSNPYWTGLFFKGLLNTVLIAVCGLLIGIVVGTLIAMVKVAPKYKRVVRVLDKICSVYVAIFRGTPMVVQLLIAYYVLLPAMGARGVEAINVGIVVFGLNSGAYVSEIMRSGILSVDAGQREAGRALGLSYPSTMLRIVLPQALKNSLPALGNELIALVKDTSVAGFIAVFDLTQAFKLIGSSSYEFMIPYLVLALFYLVIVGILTVIIKMIERRFAKSDK